MKNWYTITAKAEERTAEIAIFDSIGATWDGEGVSAKQFIADLKALDADKITLLVNSPGGSVFDGLAIYAALVESKAEITGKVMGLAASAASFILMACKTVSMPENSFLMIHNPSTMAWGDSAAMRETASFLDKIGDSLVNIYATRTKQTVDQVKAWLDAETWFSAAEAKEHGFADSVTGAFHATAQFEVDKLPEHIRAVFNSATPPVIAPAPAAVITAPVAGLADQIKVAAEAAGLPELAPLLAVDASIVDAAGATAALQLAADVKALCVVAGMPDRADALMRSRKSLVDARAELCTALAEEDAKRPVVTAPTAASTEPKPTATVDIGAIYAKANANTPLKRSN